MPDATREIRPWQPGWRSDVAAVVVGLVVGVIVRLALDQLYGGPYPFIPFLIGTAVTLWLARGRAAVATLVVGFFLGLAMLAPPAELVPLLRERTMLPRVVLYWLVGAIGLTLALALGAARRRAALFAVRAETTAGEAERWQALTQLILDSAPVGIALFAEDGRVVWGNRALVAMSGISADELHAAPFTERFPDVDPIAREIFDGVVRTGEPVVGVEVKGRTPDSPRMHVWRGSLYRVRRPADSAIAIAAVIEEITEQRAALDRLRESEGRFREIANLIPQIVWTADASGHVDYYNQQWLDYVGMTAEAAAEHGWRDVMHPDDLARVEEEWARAVRAQTPVEIEFRQRERDGEFRWFLCRAVPARDEHGNVLRWLGTSTDIDDKRRAEEALRIERDLVDTVNRVGQAMLGELDLERLLRSIAEATTRLLDADVAAFVPEAPTETALGFVLPAAGEPDATAGMLATLRASPVLEPVFREQRCIRRTADRGRGAALVGEATAEPSIRSLLAAPVVSRAGELLGVLVFGRRRPEPFGERDQRMLLALVAQMAIGIENARLYDGERRARAAAEAANLAKDEFVAVLSHELRSPLNAASLWLDLIRSERITGQEARSGIETIHRSVRLLQRLIEDLLDVSRMVTGTVEVQHALVDATAPLRRAMAEQQAAYDAKGVRLVPAGELPHAPVLGDTARLQQVFGNLLTNAVKFTPRGGEVTVAVELDPHAVTVVVRDTGQGIAPDLLPRLFDRFWQADPSSTRRASGLGLGLAIARHLVERHGGTITAESAGEGQGATFRVRLPLASPVEAESPASRAEALAPRAPREQPLAGVSVLVVDDDTDAIAALRTVLHDAGAAVRTAASAEEALEALRIASPDVLLSDIAMPGVDGYELIDTVRRRERGANGHLPAVAVTAYATSSDRRRAIRAGYDEHLAKPIEPATVVSLVARLAASRAA